ncbi:MAG: radical SAM protein [SAR324 cluster bacterium]|nr:radical SAM protein [SAR324 cluster bacterium]
MEYVPKWIAWETTERCNLSCVHCRCSSDMTKDLFTLDTQKSLALIDNIASYCQPVFVLSGGEPLMRPDLYEIARYGNQKDFRMCIATNGAMLDDTHCEQMKESGIRMVSMSLDGSVAAIHDNFRGVPGAYEGVMQAAERLNRFGIKFLINSSFTKRNQHDIAATFKKAKELGATAWYMFMIVPTGRGEDVMAELVDAEDYNEILEWHYNQEKREDQILMRPTCAPHYYRMVLQLNKKAEKEDKLKRRSLTFSTGGGKGCIASQSICFINAKGDVNPCSYLPLSGGNLFEKPFKEIWENSKLFQDMRDFKSYKGRCGACEYLNVCGGCRARAYSVTGDYMSEEPFCDHIPHKLREKTL